MSLDRHRWATIPSHRWTLCAAMRRKQSNCYEVCFDYIAFLNLSKFNRSRAITLGVIFLFLMAGDAREARRMLCVLITMDNTPMSQLDFGILSTTQKWSP